MKFPAFALIVAGLLGASLVFAAEPTPAEAPAAEAPKSDVKTIVSTVCAACHGADGNSVVTANPSLAGQHAAYLTKQLNNFKSGERKNPVMAGMAAILTPEDMVKAGEYFAAQTAKSASAKENGPGSLGEKIYKGGVASSGVAACAACHGPTGAGIPAQFPRLAGQHSEYLIAQLKAFKSGERGNDTAKMMQMIAAKMSDQEIAAVADYLQGLR